MTRNHKTLHIEGFADRLNEAIWDTGLDTREIERRAMVAHNNMWSYRERGVTPKCDVLIRLAITLDVSVDWLLGISKVKKRY